MKIGIIGAGNIGGAWPGGSPRWARGGGGQLARPETLADLAAETGAKAVPVTEAARGREVVVVTIPKKNIPDLPADLFAGVPRRRGRRRHRQLLPAAARRPHRRDRGGPDREPLGRAAAGPAGDQGVQQHLRQALLDRGRPKGTAGRIALPVAGDDAAAKAVVMRLVDELGFDAVDAGGLDESWRQQPGTPVYGTDLDAEGVRRALSEASPERRPEWRAM